MSSTDTNLDNIFYTKTFIDIYPTVDAFLTAVTAAATAGIPDNLTLPSKKVIYYMLYAQYGNSHIANLDENQFAYKLFTLMYMYGYSWQQRRAIQDKLCSLGLESDDVLIGASQIYNHAFNPSTAPSTATVDELTAINEQNTAKNKKNKLQAYSELYDIIRFDITKEFVNRFKILFLQIVKPYNDLYYTTEVTDDEVI